MYPGLNKARQRIPVHKAKGVTPTERYLNRLCEQTFLSLWSYPGAFRDQKTNGKGDGKELCDMLVVFDEHVLIFSDKQCAFPETGDLELDWKRWHKRAIQKSADQAWGAERWLKSNPQRVFLDRACTQPFPLNIPSASSAMYHLILVAHGSEERCKANFGGSGSLMLNSLLGQRGDKSKLTSTPFTVGDLDPSRTFVHTLTESTLAILLQTLDTIGDFISYLEKKARLFRSNVALLVSGEEDLLAFYLMRINDNGEHHFEIEENFNGLLLEEGFWGDFYNSTLRKEQVKQNKISYLWDDLIERFSYHALNATQYFTNHTELSETEIGLRLMAREPRSIRRFLMQNLVELYTNTPDGTRRIKYFKSGSPGGPHYVFLSLPQPTYASYEEYREVRGALLEACLMVVKYKYPESLDIVGVASEPVQAGIGSSEDLLYLDAREWSDELNEEAAKLQKEFKILTSTVAHHARVKEYPEGKRQPIKYRERKIKIGRNEQCPCGSGKKYKFCHGR